jgi:two-component system, OmpR family, response regulator
VVSMEKLIYIVDDEQNIRHLIRMFLLKEGFRIEDFHDGHDMLARFSQQPADLVILDILMPSIDGYSLCSQLRKISDVPIVFVSARDAEVDRIAGFMLGGDDYLTKPFSPMELVMRVKAIFNRTAKDRTGKQTPAITYGDITLDTALRQARCKGNMLELTNLELDMLAYLAENSIRAVGRDELLEHVWQFKEETESRATDDTVKRLRKKLEAAASNVVIETAWGFGFKLAQKGQSD